MDSVNTVQVFNVFYQGILYLYIQQIVWHDINMDRWINVMPVYIHVINIYILYHVPVVD